MDMEPLTIAAVQLPGTRTGSWVDGALQYKRTGPVTLPVPHAIRQYNFSRALAGLYFVPMPGMTRSDAGGFDW